LIIARKEDQDLAVSQSLVVAGSIDRISRRVNFYVRLEGNPPSPPKMMLTTFFGSWKS
jgi:hypothetical protein